KNEFKSFQWEGDVPDPQSTQTFFNSRLLWNFHANIQKSHIFNYYKALIKARKEGVFASLRDKDVKINFREKGNFLSSLSGEGKQAVFACYNFGGKDQLVRFPEGKLAWSKIIASSDLHWAGPREMEKNIPGGQEVLVPPTSLTLYIR